MSTLLTIGSGFRLTLFLWCLSLAALATALAAAEFGAPVWVFVLLLGWLLTAGLPTAAAVLVLARFWCGPSFSAFLVTAALLGLACQHLALAALRRALKRRHRQPA
jgi:hypothetical protein